MSSIRSGFHTRSDCGLTIRMLESAGIAGKSGEQRQWIKQTVSICQIEGILKGNSEAKKRQLVHKGKTVITTHTEGVDPILSSKIRSLMKLTAEVDPCQFKKYAVDEMMKDEVVDKVPRQEIAISLHSYISHTRLQLNYGKLRHLAGNARIPSTRNFNLTEQIEGLPDHGFRIRLDHQFSKKGKPFTVPKLHQLPSFMGILVRYLKKWNEVRRQGKRMFVDLRDATPLQQIYGVPLGGIGCGSIGRGFRGEFCRFQMIPGMYKWKTMMADQFIVRISKDGETVFQQVLSAHKPPKDRLKCWRWEFNGANAIYHGLYPRSWTVYNINDLKVKLICRQVSPVIPHEYKDSSLPTAVFVWTIENNSDDNFDVSIALAFQNGIGKRKDDLAGGIVNDSFQSQKANGDVISGVSINQKLKDMDCSYLISATQTTKNTVSKCIYFDPLGDGSTIWQQLESKGEFESNSDRSAMTAEGQMSGAAVCVKTHVIAHSNAKAEMCLAWHMPVVKFGSGGKTYKRRYVRWFNGENPGVQLSAHALDSYSSWEKQIADWQKPILESALPSWYKSAIFNELYFISDGGTVWLDEVDIDAGENRLTNEYGKFAYLEGHEYRMYNTYDVHFYASYALIMNWPKIQLSLQYDMAHVVDISIPKVISYIADGKRGPIKERSCVPHDIGDPEDEPWINVNCYQLHPTGDWKDLNTKFILQVMRDYHVTKDALYLQDMFPTVLTLLQKTLEFDTDGDGMIENGGYADQTYDVWTATGTSTYCGGLWLAALRCTVEMCRILDKPEEEKLYSDLLIKATEAFDRKLWNGKYYNYDSSKSRHHKHIMSDQLCGHWYLKSCGIFDDDVFPPDKVKSALLTVFENNVMNFGDGMMGAINGCKPDGSADRTTLQSEEFWTGVSYSLAANFLQENMLKEAFQTAYGVYREVYEQRGLGYQTPEAYTDGVIYRSLGYMRPLCIWSIQWAIEQYHNELLNGVSVLERHGKLHS